MPHPLTGQPIPHIAAYRVETAEDLDGILQELKAKGERETLVGIDAAGHPFLANLTLGGRAHATTQAGFLRTPAALAYPLAVI